jgi:transcriptional regulator with XRE-family HTH domain
MAADKKSKAAKAAENKALLEALSDRFSKTLVELREAADLSQEEVAIRAGIHRTQISLMEGGERLPRFPTIVRVAGALGVEPGALFKGIEYKPPMEVTGAFEIE